MPVVNAGIRVLLGAFLIAAGPHALATKERLVCNALLVVLADESKGVADLPDKVRRETLTMHSGVSLKQVAQTAGILLRLSEINKSLIEFQRALPPGGITPQVLETTIQPFSNEFALLPSTDPTERARIKSTEVAVKGLLADPRTPPVIAQKIEFYWSTVKAVGLEPGLPFTQLVNECVEWNAN